jgi:hypothetical protein
MHTKWSTIGNLGFEIRSRGSTDDDIRMEKGSFPQLPLINFWHLDDFAQEPSLRPPTYLWIASTAANFLFRILCANCEYLTNVSRHKRKDAIRPRDVGSLLLAHSATLENTIETSREPLRSDEVGKNTPRQLYEIALPSFTF